MNTFAVKGGIGDFLQCLPFMLAHKDNRYLVATHYDRPWEFFDQLGIYTTYDVSLGRLGGVKECPRQTFFGVNPFPRRPPIFTGNRPVVGIHLGGSGYSLSVEKRFGFPPKALPRSILDGIIAGGNEYDLLLFGSPEELDEIGCIGHARKVRNDNIIVSLSHVAECSAFIGSDSAFKTMSAMLEIPTIVLMGDYRDGHRDSRFIEPYDDVIATFRYKDLTNPDEVAAAVEFCLELLEAKCLVSQT